jgi:hypothetical protein
MNSFLRIYFFMSQSFTTTIYLLLRRTLVRLVILFGKATIISTTIKKATEHLLSS